MALFGCKTKFQIYDTIAITCKRCVSFTYCWNIEHPFSWDIVWETKIFTTPVPAKSTRTLVPRWIIYHSCHISFTLQSCDAFMCELVYMPCWNLNRGLIAHDKNRDKAAPLHFVWYVLFICRYFKYFLRSYVHAQICACVYRCIYVYVSEHMDDKVIQMDISHFILNLEIWKF